MVAERYLSTFTLSQVITTTPTPLQGHFRSKLFVVSSTTNPLLAAAEPLLSLIERLNIAQELPDLTLVHDNIEHELRAFRSRLASQRYSEELTAIAHYLLTATIDELLGKNYLRIYGTSATFNAFTPASFDDLGPERHVFRIIHSLKERTNHSLNVLELAYFCLITGFEGEYHLRPDGRQALENLIEELHQLIRQQRVTKPYRPFKEAPVSYPKPTATKLNFFIGLGILISLSSVYFATNVLLDHKATHLLHLIERAG